MKNENTQNRARRFRIVVTDLQEDETLMDVTTNAAIVSTTSPFDNLTNEDKDGYSQGAHYFNGKSIEIMRCIQCTIEGISKLAADHKELGLLLNLYMLEKKAESLKEDEDNE